MPTSSTAPASEGQNCAVINPFALAEAVAGRKIPWATPSDPRRMLEEILGTPYRELFDPKYGGPLYIGHRLDEKLRLVPQRSPLLDLAAPTEGNDVDLDGLDNLGRFPTLPAAARRSAATMSGTVSGNRRRRPGTGDR